MCVVPLKRTALTAPCLQSIEVISFSGISSDIVSELQSFRHAQRFPGVWLQSNLGSYLPLNTLSKAVQNYLFS